MAASASGRERRPRKLVKGGITSKRKHRFESFNQRIAKLNIDPVRRSHRNAVEDNELQSFGSFFRTSLDRWKDLNLSETFTSFVREVDPISNSLPQVLHYNQRILDTLLHFIEKRDILSLEPLMDLLASFAHDLGVRFEDHFAKTVTMVASVAAKHPDVEAIEWGFTCLAWLFKYLSRLLVPNLKPVFAIMAPLLGRESQKPHTIRFAAEAMSFLVRKAATIHAKNPEPLEIIVDAVKSDVLVYQELCDSRTKSEIYKHGVMTLLVDSMKGIERKLNSGAIRIYQCMIERLWTDKDENDDVLLDIVSGVTVALIHHTDADTFSPILDIVLEIIRTREITPHSLAACTCPRLLFIVCTARKGTRVRDWTIVLDALLRILQHLDQCAPETVSSAYRAAAVIMQSSPLDLVLPKIRLVMDTISTKPLAAHFLFFCSYCCDIDQQRFQNLILPYLSKFIISHWQDHELELCLCLPKLNESRTPAMLSCPAAWQDHIVRTFAKAGNCDKIIVQCHSYIELMDCMTLTGGSQELVVSSLEDMLHQELSSTSLISEKGLFIFGTGLRLLSHHLSQAKIQEMWPLLCARAPIYGLLPSYLQAMLLLVENSQVLVNGAEVLLRVLFDNIRTASHEVRKLSLEISDALYAHRHGKKAEILQTALAIETTPLDLQSARAMSMHARKLGPQYEGVQSDEWLQNIIPNFCFGMLTFKLSQAWDNALIALRKICETKIGEEIVSSLAFSWLEAQETSYSLNYHPASEDTPRPSPTNFECSHLSKIEDIMDRDSKELQRAFEYLQTGSRSINKMVSRKVENSRSLALGVFRAVPHIAEGRSRQLVPLFLSWAIQETENMEDQTEEPLVGQKDSQALCHDHSTPKLKTRRKERQAMLDLFGSFQNPKVLYRSSDVFMALQNLLTNGDVDLQRSALKALFSWKLQSVQPYQENLLNLLDEARFRDEIATFLQIDDENSIIREEHRPGLMPILLRLLYGRMIAGTGSKNQTGKRKAVLQALSRLNDNYLGDFVHIMLGPLGKVDFADKDFLAKSVTAEELLTVRKQVGLVNMVKDMLEVLGDRLSRFGQELMSATLYCLVRAANFNLREKDAQEQNTAGEFQHSLRKVVRHAGLQCTNLLFRYCSLRPLTTYLPSLFEKVLSPKLDRLPIETAQSVSIILQLFSTWASSQDSALILAEYNTGTMQSIINCLDVPSARDEVKLFVLDAILKPIVDLARNQSKEVATTSGQDQPAAILKKVLEPNMNCLLNVTGALLRKNPSKGLLHSTVRFISTLASLVKGISQAFDFLEICTFLLDQPSGRVNPGAKGELLQVVYHFILLVDSPLPSELQEHIFRTTSSLFGYFKDRDSRILLSQAFVALATKDDELQDVARLCVSLNAFSTTKLDEVDFDERLNAFNAINETKFKDFTSKQWRPILYNMVYYVRDTEELAIRSNASCVLRRFVEGHAVLVGDSESKHPNLLTSILLPALRDGVSEASELVRTEYLTILAHLIRCNPNWEAVNDMSPLLVSDDEEASFFGNVLHIQQHRRLRALRRLATEAKKGTLNSGNVAHFFIPFIEHFIFDKADDDSAHNLGAEAVVTIGALATSLEWPQFRAVLRRYTTYVTTKPEAEKTVIKLLGIMIDSLAGAATEKKGQDHERGWAVDSGNIPNIPKQKRNLMVTMPSQEKLGNDLNDTLLRGLEKYIHGKDESTVSLRVPVALAVVKLLKLLPTARFRERLPPVLTDVAHILRSRAQESRDLTRKTLVEISSLIGPSYFGFVLDELRSSLSRGYQLHVLSYTVHSILVATSPIFKSGDLDYCLPQIVAVVMDDIFGVAGQEKDAEDYISKMREVKSSKSYDMLELVAKTATVEHFAQLIRPLQVLLEEKLDLRMVKKIDELLRRISVGLQRNEAVQDQRVLIFCYEIIDGVYKKQGPSQKSSKEDYRLKRFLINYKGANKFIDRGSTTMYRYKLSRFAFDLLRLVLQKHGSLQTSANLAGFVPIIGDAIIQPNEEVQTSALRLLTAIIKVPLNALDRHAPIYVAECVKIIKASISTNVEIAQAALKLVSATLRERQAVDIRENDLAYLLKRLIPDLEEPDKQGVAFNFLKAIMTRKIVIAEVYEVLDAVAAIMVTNSSRGARDMARGAYFHFIMEYPQSKDRFAKQIGFLVRNLDYDYEEGRQSVMEAVHLLLNKVGEDMVQDFVGTFFVPLVMVIVNDEISRCREMAGALLKKIFERADTERTHKILGLLHTWLSDSEDPVLQRAGLQVYGIYLETNSKAAVKEVPHVKPQLSHFLKTSLKNPAEADWELLYFSLETFAKICHSLPVDTFAIGSATVWASVRQCVFFPHAWVKLSAAKLLGMYFADFARSNTGSDDLSLPLKGSGGLWLTEQEIVEITRASLNLLRIPGVSEELANQSVRNLVFLGRTMVQTSMKWPQKAFQASEDHELKEGDFEHSDDNHSSPSGQGQESFEGFDPPQPSTTKPALGHLIRQASLLLRRGALTNTAPSLPPLQSSLRLLGALTSTTPLRHLTPHIPTLLIPLHNLTDPSIPAPSSPDPIFTDGYKALVSNAQELLSVLQGKLGTMEFVKVMGKVREGVKGRREERRVKRRIETVRQPEVSEGKRRRKGERKKERRKEKGGEFRALRRGW